MKQELYQNIIAVTNRHLCKRAFMEQMERVCRLQPKAVILREKDLSEEEYLKLAEEVLEMAEKYKLYNTGVKVEKGDRFITLVTCEYSNKNGRMVIIAKKVK